MVVDARENSEEVWQDSVVRVSDLYADVTKTGETQANDNVELVDWNEMTVLVESRRTY